MTFLDRLRAAIGASDSFLCLGLDPELDRLPAGIPRSAEGVLRFNREIIAATRDLVCAYKPNLAFYEALGPAGYDVLARTMEAIPREVVTIGDAKRGDIGNTARLYAKALFEQLGFDAATVNPYQGRDAVQPFLDYAERGVFVVCRSSNPGAADFQDLTVQTSAGPMDLAEAVADQVQGWNHARNAGLVVGATAPDELARLRARAPELPFLVPGVGAQGGSLRAAVSVSRSGAPAIVNASRAILYASSDADFAEAARRAAREVRDAMRRARDELGRG